MVWDIQIVSNFFIVTMLKLSVDGAIRCDAGQGARAALLNCVDRSFLILLNLNHVDEVTQAVGLCLVILHQGFALGEPETRCGG